MTAGPGPSGAILFDFDGTLVDTRQASWEVFADTNARFRLGVDTREAYFDIFQGNFHQSFEALSDDKDLIRQAKQHFESALRDRYRPSLIPGMVDVIKALTPVYTLAVVSSNGMAVIRRCLEEAGVANCFGHVFSGDVERSKSAVIERFMADQSYATLRHCVPAYVDDTNGGPRLATENVFLVTDTVGDLEEADRVGIRAIGVCWGMHDEPSLLAAGAEAVMVWPQELVAFFATAGVEAPESCRVDRAPEAEYTVSGAGPSQPVEAGDCRCAESPSPGSDHRATRVAARLRTRLAARPTSQPVVEPSAMPSGRAVDRELVDALARTAVP